MAASSTSLMLLVKVILTAKLVLQVRHWSIYGWVLITTFVSDLKRDTCFMILIHMLGIKLLLLLLILLLLMLL